MENTNLTPHASVLSRSSLHAYITGPVNAEPAPKSSFNPYRKRSALLSFLSLEAVEEALLKTEESVAVETPKIISLPESIRPLTVTAASS
jgi:hypothetical protein